MIDRFRARDLLISGAALGATAPLLGLVAVAVKLDSPGPVFFRQERVGLDRRSFPIIKFRSMTHRDLSREDYLIHGRLSGDDDPRITRVGRILRKTSLDELPQLFNVLAGDMSLVGPRPVVPAQLAAMPAERMIRFTVPPGLTGLAQVSGRQGLAWPEKLHLDCKYSQTRSFIGDLGIMLRTVPALLKSDTVYGSTEDNWRDYILDVPAQTTQRA